MHFDSNRVDANFDLNTKLNFKLRLGLKGLILLHCYSMGVQIINMVLISQNKVALLDPPGHDKIAKIMTTI